jgi:hypothetical protein
LGKEPSFHARKRRKGKANETRIMAKAVGGMKCKAGLTNTCIKAKKH